MTTAHEVKYPRNMVRSSRNEHSKLDRVDDPLGGGMHRRLREFKTDTVRTLDLRGRLCAGLEAEAVVTLNSETDTGRSQEASALTRGGSAQASQTRTGPASVNPRRFNQSTGIAGWRFYQSDYRGR